MVNGYAIFISVTDGINAAGEVKLNYVKHGRQVIEKPNLDCGGVAFYEGDSNDDAAFVDMARWLTAIETDTDPCVLPEQAATVTRILEAIYTSAKTGAPVFFD